MIRIKDYIFNENRIVQICINEMNNLEIDTDNGFPIVIKNATLEDIEWNYEDKQIRKCLESTDREEELEEENKNLQQRIDKAIEYIEENYPTSTIYYQYEKDKLLKILKGEE